MIRAILIPLCLSATLFATPGRVSAVFEPNHGQAPVSAEFVVRTAAGTVQISPALATLKGQSFQFAINLDGASRSAVGRGEDALPGVIHYLGGAKDVPTYSRVRYRSIYPGIDIVYYFRDGLLEYDFELAPGADSRRIRLRFGGVPHPRINAAGDLVFPGGVNQHRPVIYQDVDGRRQTIPGRYRLHGNAVSLAIGRYDRTRPLVIDPVITWATYFGGGNSDNGESIAVDPSGNIYVTGSTISSFGDTDVFVAKLTPDGTRSLFTSVFPGSGNDYGHAIAADSAGNVYLTGETSSTDFLADFTYLSRNASGGVPHVFVSKVDSTGRNLVYSHYVAGAGAEIGYAIALDSSNNIYIAGATSSPDFLVTAGVAQPTRPGGIEAFAMRFDASGARAYGTYLGGSGDDYAYGVAVDSSGNAYISGATTSTNFPVSAGAYQSRNAGGYDAFVTKLSPTGTLIYASYLGGAGDDFANAIAIDTDGAAYLTGETSSTDFPSIGAYQPASAGGSGEIFVTKFAADAASLVYSTYLGGSGEDFTSGIALDPANNVYLIGSTTSTDFPVRDAFQSANGGGATSAIVAALDSSGATLLFSSYLGGSGTAGTASKIGDSGSSLAMSCASGLVLIGSTASTNFPVTPGVIGGAFIGGITDAFIVKLGIGGVPVIAAGGVVNSVTYSPGNVSPGSLVSIFGSGFAWGAQPLAVAVNGAPAPVLASTAGQINIQLPYSVAAGSASVTVASPCGPSNAVTFQVSNAAPYIRATASGDAIADAAKAGGTLTLSLIGIGPVDNPVPAGTPTPSTPPSKATLPASATIAGIDTTIQFLGLTPGTVGLAQAILNVPSQLAPGAYPVSITVGGVTSNSVTVSIQ